MVLHTVILYQLLWLYLSLKWFIQDFSEWFPTPCLGIARTPPASIKNLQRFHSTTLISSLPPLNSTLWKFSLHFGHIFRTDWNFLTKFGRSDPSFNRSILTLLYSYIYIEDAFFRIFFWSVNFLFAKFFTSENKLYSLFKYWYLY